MRLAIEFFHGSFEQHGIDVYRAHYRQLEEVLGERKYLQWTVEDGWYVARFFSMFNLRPMLTAVIGNPCAPSLKNRYRTRLSPAVMHRWRLRSGSPRGESLSSDKHA